MSQMSCQMSHLWHFQWGKWIMDYGIFRIRPRNMEGYFSTQFLTFPSTLRRVTGTHTCLRGLFLYRHQMVLFWDILSNLGIQSRTKPMSMSVFFPDHDALVGNRKNSRRFQFVKQPDIYDASVRWMVANAVLGDRSTQPRFTHAKVLVLPKFDAWWFHLLHSMSSGATCKHVGLDVLHNKLVVRMHVPDELVSYTQKHLADCSEWRFKRVPALGLDPHLIMSWEHLDHVMRSPCPLSLAPLASALRQNTFAW